MEEAKRKRPCHGQLWEKREGDKVTLELKCAGDCDGKEDCTRQKSGPDDHGTVTEWCACNDDTRGCNIYLETKADGSQRFDCFTLGCNEEQVCTLVENGRIETPGVTVVKWICECRSGD